MCIRDRVNIAAEFFNDVEISAIVISDELGKILYEKILMEKDLNKDFNQEFERYLDRQHHVTIFNEYLDIYGEPYFKVRTFYNVKEEIIIVEPPLSEFSDRAYIDLKLNVHGVNELHGIIMNSGNQDNYQKVRNKSKKELLKILYALPVASDLYFVLHGNEEHFFRYIYLPQDEILKTNDLFWEDLPRDLKEHELVFPDKEKWQGFIRATSEFTDNTCYFYELTSRDFYETTHKYFIPESLFFYDYEFYFSRNAKVAGYQRSYSYYGKSDEILTLPKIIEKDFDYDLEYYDRHGFDFQLVKKMDEVYLHCFLELEEDFSSYSFIPQWIIKAENTDEINFKYPILSDLILNVMPDLVYSTDNQPTRIRQIQKKDGACDLSVSDDIKN